MMNHLQGISVMFWSANHIALRVTKNEYTFKEGNFALNTDEEDKPIKIEKFRAFTHDSEFRETCTAKGAPTTIKVALDYWFDCRRTKTPSVIDDFWEDCSQYIREDQVEMLKSVYQIMIEYNAFDDDEDFEEEYDDEDEIQANDRLTALGFDTRTGTQRREDSLKAAEEYEPLTPLVMQLRENKTPLQKKYIILDFVETLKQTKGLGIDLSDEADEDTMYGKLPIKEWLLPLGNSLMQQDENNAFLDNLNLFGLHGKGIDNGINKFDDPKSLVNTREKEVYYKFYSRYHNCAGYSRFLLEQGGITAFASTNELEKFGVTDPSKYNDYMIKVSNTITEINDKARELMKNSGVKPEPLEDLNTNYLANFKTSEPNYESLTWSVQSLLDQYNNELVDISYEHKIVLLTKLVLKMHEKGVTNPMIIDALQKETRRSYEIDFDAQFSHNQHFQLQVLSACAALSVAALAVGILAIAFPLIIPVLLATAIAITVTAAAASALSITLFALKSGARRPSPESLGAKNKEATVNQEAVKKSEDADQEQLVKDDPDVGPALRSLR